MTPQKIILDCDPGIDDALAILLAHGNPNVEIVAITTVAGNQVLEKVTRNALALGELVAIKGVPFAAGCASPLLRQPQIADDIHGDSGLGNVTLPTPTKIQLDKRHGVQVIIDTIMNNEPKTITLVPTGALTNVALAVKMEPRIVDRVKEVVLMGGAYNTGNRTPVAEFNVYTDPEAAYIVFNQSWKLTMIGLDLTHQASATEKVLEMIKGVETNVSKIVLQLLDFYNAMYRREAKFPHCVVHDACAVAYVINSGIIETQRCPITVELNGKHTYGMTVADLRPASASIECNSYVATKLNWDAFWDLVVDALKRLGDPKW